MTRLVIASAFLVAGTSVYMIYRMRSTPSKQAPKKPKVYDIPDIEDLDPCEHGFDRPKEGTHVEIHGSLKPLTHHFLVGTSVAPKDWLNEAGDSSPLLKSISAVEVPKGTRISAHLYYAPETAGSSATVLLYPSRLCFTGVTLSNVSSLVSCVLQDNLQQLPPGIQSTPIGHTNIFVCAHLKRDKRCGYCGPVLAVEFEKELTARNLKQNVQVHKVSHVGGHKYAGNVMVYGPRLLDWYCYVKPEDVPELLTKTQQDDWVPRLWKGRVGIGSDEMKALKEQCCALSKDM